MYTKQFEVRWNDLDANMHLGNSSYIEYMSHTRISFFTDQNIGIEVMNGYGLGPITFFEHIYYFKEIRLSTLITVSLEVKGHSKDGRFVLFEHNFYSEQGENLAYSEMLFSWMNLKTRRLGKIPEDILHIIEGFPRSKDFNYLTKEDIKKYSKTPIPTSRDNFDG